jgi:membrane protease YdiL (CAAX protease family)
MEGTAFMNSPAASTSAQAALLKPFWTSLIGPPWIVALVVYAVVAFVRFFAFLSPYSLQELFFLQTVAMWALPFVLLTANGRRRIGLLEGGISPFSLLLSTLSGAACAAAFFSIGMALYGDSANNWCISIRGYLRLDEIRGVVSPLGIFVLYALPAIFLNPIGEEILFRGFIQQSFSERFNRAVGTAVNVVLFGLIYLYLHGIWRDAAGFHLRLGSTAIALFLMACIGTVFTLCRTLSGSLWPAMAAHAAFNLTLLAAAIHQFVR